MPNQRKYTFLFVLTGVVCILALYMHRHREGQTGKIDSILISITGYFQEHFFYLGHGTRMISEHYVMLVNAKQQKEAMEAELLGLKARLASLGDIEAENKRLRESLGLREQLKERVVLASVVAHDVSVDYVGIRINKGANDGLKVGMGVISPGGVVGRIRTVTGTYSDVATLIDPTSNIDVIIQRSRARGILSGQTKQLNCKMKYVDRLEDVALNDTVVSTDFGHIFPKGLLVGTVSEIIPNTSGVLQRVTIQPALDVFRLEEVFVVVPQPDAKTLSE